MENPHEMERETPGRGQAVMFHLKSRLLQAGRGLRELGCRPPFHPADDKLADTPVIAEKRSPLWSGLTAAEFPLTAGKVENLRRAARAFHGLEIPAGEVFSFWRQLGRTSRRKGFVAGRELREGCIIPAIGGGLCQLSGLLYQTALAAGLHIVERHAHSRVMPGSAAEQNLDATVFWNYVDLRFRAENAWRLEVELGAADLIVRIRSGLPVIRKEPAGPAPSPRAAASGDCLTCGMVSCFRHPSATAAHAPASGHSAFLLDNRWPEFDAWCADHSRDGDRWMIPLDGRRWGKPNYAWSVPEHAAVWTATFTTLWRSFRQRRLPAQGALRQKALLEGAAALARCYAAKLDPRCRHVVVSQNLLPHLWECGALGGRSFDVLIERWPMEELQRRLDEAKQAHPQSTTLADFRAGSNLLRAESEALAAAGRLITPHAALARFFGNRAWKIDWRMPPPVTRHPSATPTLFFPASRLGRKGAFELAEALHDNIGAELKFLGRADEGIANPFDGIPCSPAGPADLQTSHLLVLPAWIEHQPRQALLALASGIPVIASAECGLSPHPLLHTLSSHDPAELREAILRVLRTFPRPCAAS